MPNAFLKKPQQYTTKTELSKGITIKGLTMMADMVIVPATEQGRYSEVRNFISNNDIIYSVTYKLQNAKTEAQRKYYWSVVLPKSLPVFAKLGYEGIDNVYLAHDFWKNCYLSVMKPFRATPKGMVMERWVVKSTEELNTVECAKYFDQIILFCSECDVMIPLADPNWKL